MGVLCIAQHAPGSNLIKRHNGTSIVKGHAIMVHLEHAGIGLLFPDGAPAGDLRLTAIPVQRPMLRHLESMHRTVTRLRDGRLGDHGRASQRNALRQSHHAVALQGNALALNVTTGHIII